MNVLSVLLILLGILNFFDYVTTKVALSCANTYEFDVFSAYLMSIGCYDIVKLEVSVACLLASYMCYHSKLKPDIVLVAVTLIVCLIMLVAVLNNLLVIFSNC